MDPVPLQKLLPQFKNDLEGMTPSSTNDNGKCFSASSWQNLAFFAGEPLKGYSFIIYAAILKSRADWRVLHRLAG